MRKPANQASALLVIATSSPDSFFDKEDQDLALFTDNEGNSYITNAGFDEHASPHTGETTEDAGIPVKVSLDREHAFVIPCETCETSMLMDTAQAEALDDHKVSCVACGSTIEYVIDDDETTASDDEDEDGLTEDEMEASDDEESDDDEDLETASDEEDDEDDEETAARKSDDYDDDDDDDDDEDRPLDKVDFDDDDDEEACDEKASSDDEDDGYILIVEASPKKVKARKVVVVADEDEDETVDAEDETASDDDDSSGDESSDEDDTTASDEEDDTTETTDEDETASEEASAPELADVMLASVVDQTKPLEIIALTDTKAGAFVDDMLVATIDDDSGSWKMLRTANYQKLLGQAIKKAGLVAALEEAGFTLKVIKADVALANAAKKSDEVVASTVDSEITAFKTQLKDCMDVVATGGIHGLFAKSGVTALAQAIEATLTGANIGNAKKVTRDLLTKHLPGYSNGLIEAAHDLSLKGEDVIASFRDQISEMEPTTLDYKSAKPETASDEDDNVVVTLRPPARPSETASVAPTQPQRRFAGLFNNTL
jgi:hypothetical protein